MPPLNGNRRRESALILGGLALLAAGAGLPAASRTGPAEASPKVEILIETIAAGGGLSEAQFDNLGQNVRYTTDASLGGIVGISQSPIGQTGPKLDLFAGYAAQIQVAIAGVIQYYAGGKTVPGVAVSLGGDAGGSVTSGVNGAYQFTVNSGGNYSLTPARLSDTPASLGVTTLDITLIRRHILGIAALDSAYKVLAADVNNSSNVTTLDITLIRRVILGITNTFPSGLWRFVRSDFAFTNSLAPWTHDKSRSYPGLAVDVAAQDFIGMKLGDVNGSWTNTAGAGPASLNSEARTPNSELETTKSGSHSAIRNPQSAMEKGRLKAELPTVGPTAVTFSAGHAAAVSGSSTTVPIAVSGAKRMTSAQFTLQWDPALLEFAGVESIGLPGLDIANFGTARCAEGKLSFSWDDPDGAGVSVTDGTVIFAVQLKAIGVRGSSAIEFKAQPTVPEVTTGANLAKFKAEAGRVSIEPHLALTLGNRSSESGDHSSLRLSRLSNGRFQLRVPGQTGMAITVQSSTNLVDWFPLLTTNASRGIMEFEDAPSGIQYRFYRVVPGE